MTATAELTVQGGPDVGRVFPLVGDRTRLGSGAGNEVQLTDPQVAEHHATLIQREGRYAIVTTHPGGLEIDGATVPPERWIWLPAQSVIRLGGQTVLQFTAGDAAATSPASEDPPVASEPPSALPAEGSGRPKAPRASKPRRAVAPASPVASASAPSAGEADVVPEAAEGARNRKTTDRIRKTARFVTEGPGEALVRQVEGGQLPELALAEGGTAARAEAPKAESNPWLLYGVLGASLLLTVLLIFLDAPADTNQAPDRLLARRELKEYLGGEEETLAPYQLALRRALQASARGDRTLEQTELRRVLRMIRSESKERTQRFTGLTGRLEYEYDDPSRKSDRRLEELIGALLADP
jgi:hypothetical protein